MYLHYTSAHHAPSKTKGPFGQYLKLRRICTKDDGFEYNAEKLIGIYQKSGYPTGALINHKKAASNTHIQILSWSQITTPLTQT